MKSIVKASLIAATVSIVMLEFGCSRSITPNTNLQDLNLTPTEKRVVSAGGSFAFDLFGKMSEQARGKNFFMSPLSVSMALAMTMNGAIGQTYDDMQKTLGLSGLSEQEINQSYRNIISLFGNLDPNVKFSIANSIWYRNTFAVPEAFLDVNKDYFDAGVKSADFSDPHTVDIINSWIDGKTNGKIPKVLEQPIDSTIIMYLINALYFNGTWEYQFDKSQTKPLPFYFADGTKKDVETMTVHDTLRYFTDANVEVVELPYGKGDYSMLILLPGATSSFNDLTSSLSSGKYDAILRGLHTEDVQVELPKFTMKYDTLLNDPLKALGMELAFDPFHANFSRMKTSVCHDTIYISRVIHSTYVDVNEEGTEAAAVTVVEMARAVNAGEPSGTIFFKVNKPFVFLIKENHENTVMFMGAVVNPVSEPSTD